MNNAMNIRQKLPAFAPIFVASVVSLSATTTSVQTADVELRPIVRETRQPAKLLALHSADIGSRVDGYVKEVLVDLGDAVEQGDVLARVDASSADSARLEMSLRSAKANVAAHAENARIKELVEKKSLSEKVALESKSKLAAARAELAAAEAESEIAAAKLEAAEALVSFTELRARLPVWLLRAPLIWEIRSVFAKTPRYDTWPTRCGGRSGGCGYGNAMRIQL